MTLALNVTCCLDMGLRLISKEGETFLIPQYSEKINWKKTLSLLLLSKDLKALVYKIMQA